MKSLDSDLSVFDPLPSMSKTYQTDLSDSEWARIEPHLPVPKAVGRPWLHPPREILATAGLEKYAAYVRWYLGNIADESGIGLVHRGPASLAEVVVEGTGLPRPTAHRLLSAAVGAPRALPLHLPGLLSGCFYPHVAEKILNCL
jgi:hypothetical protein